MKAEYKRDMYRNYLVVLPDEKQLPGYEVEMLQSNRIKGFLTMQIKSIDGQNFYYYDVSSLQPCSEIYQKAKLSRKQIMELAEEIIETVEKGKEFLLTEDNFVLDPKYLYINPGNFKVSLCYHPGYGKEIAGQLNSLFEFILDRADYREEGAVLLAYGLYKQSRSKAASVSELKVFLKEESLSRQEKQAGKQEKIKPEEPRLPVEQKAWEINRVQEGGERKKSGQQKQVTKPEQEVEEKSGRKLEKQPESGSNKLSKEISVLCTGAVFSGIFILFLLYRFGVFTNPLGGQFETTRFSLFCLLIASIEASVLHVWHSMKNRQLKKQVGNELNTSKGNTILGVGADRPNAREAFSGPVIYKYDIEVAELSSIENTTLLLKESDVYDADSYCLSALDSKIYQDIRLVEFPFFIGKLKTNVDYVLEHATISRFHAKIEKEQEHFFLTDLNSTNGTFLNGRRLLPNERTAVLPGDQIAFAQINYIFNKI